MTGSEYALQVYSGNTPIARLMLASDLLHWDYLPQWRQSGYAVSPHLPLNKTIPHTNILRFLRNLLPEGNALDELLNTFHLSRNNTFALIRALGGDTPGALVFKPAGLSFSENTTFRLLPETELEHRLNVRDQFSLVVWDGKPRLSVAGVQDKINVVLDENNQLGFGEGELCSTHILKFERRKSEHLVLNEYVTMQLAKQCGLNVANVSLLRFGSNPALLVERFDRKLTDMSHVKRRHMIDGCQALNLSPEYKYERNLGSGRDVAHIRDGASLSQLFIFAKQCANPAETKQHMLDWVLFNTLVFNCDAHGKNISFFVGTKGMRLTPFYDLVNIKMYPEFEHELAMALGDEFDGNDIHAYQLADFADTCGLSRRFLANRLKDLAKNLIGATTDFAAPVSSMQEENYIHEYKKIIITRSEYLLSEADYITSIQL